MASLVPARRAIRVNPTVALTVGAGPGPGPGLSPFKAGPDFRRDASVGTVTIPAMSHGSIAAACLMLFTVAGSSAAQTPAPGAGPGPGPGIPRTLATARAAEVVLCLREYHTAEGCADLLYATRLAGAPLNPAAAVA